MEKLFFFPPQQSEIYGVIISSHLGSFVLLSVENKLEAGYTCEPAV